MENVAGEQDLALQQHFPYKTVLQKAYLISDRLEFIYWKTLHNSFFHIHFNTLSFTSANNWKYNIEAKHVNSIIHHWCFVEV